ncbi:hypothetical protein RIR_jg21939.t1 [Rhizophagus irregularis DAOM 181602=DAOM 197198]|nr:hypothetical protein RIR_jg21939.t1 [Rhizophagus irregularis DAOM 181602=DAOM 197198]
MSGDRSEFRNKIQKLLSAGEETSNKRRGIESSMSSTSSMSENSYEVFNEQLIKLNKRMKHIEEMVESDNSGDNNFIKTIIKIGFHILTTKFVQNFYQNKDPTNTFAVLLDPKSKTIQTNENTMKNKIEYYMECPYCSRTFSSKSGYTQHVKHCVPPVIVSDSESDLVTDINMFI